MSVATALWNVGAKTVRRLASAHKPLVRTLRRHERAQELNAFDADVAALDRQIAEVAAGGAPIVVGPWLAEVGYEVLYWIPFLRWFVHTFKVDPSRLTVISRGGIERAYAGIADRYIDLFDLLTADDLRARNAARQALYEGGGQKQSGFGSLDEELFRMAGLASGASRVLHPSLMFRLFRHAWHGNVPMDVLWSHTRYEPWRIAPARNPALPPVYTAVKVYTGPALGHAASSARAVSDLLAQVAATTPLVVLTTRFGADEHQDFDLAGLPGVVDVGAWMTPRHNLGLQLSIIAGARTFVGTCGGLAWVAPFLGVPTVALYDDDHLLAPHLLVERQAGTRTGAAEFSTLDVRTLGRLQLALAVPSAMDLRGEPRS